MASEKIKQLDAAITRCDKSMRSFFEAHVQRMRKCAAVMRKVLLLTKDDFPEPSSVFVDSNDLGTHTRSEVTVTWWARERQIRLLCFNDKNRNIHFHVSAYEYDNNDDIAYAHDETFKYNNDAMLQSVLDCVLRLIGEAERGEYP